MLKITKGKKNYIAAPRDKYMLKYDINVAHRDVIMEFKDADTNITKTMQNTPYSDNKRYLMFFIHEPENIDLNIGQGTLTIKDFYDNVLAVYNYEVFGEDAQDSYVEFTSTDDDETIIFKG